MMLLILKQSAILLSMKNLRTSADLVKELRRLVARFPTQQEFADTYDVNRSHVCLVLLGKRSPGPKLARLLGYRSVAAYEPLQTRGKDAP